MKRSSDKLFNEPLVNDMVPKLSTSTVQNTTPSTSKHIHRTSTPLKANVEIRESPQSDQKIKKNRRRERKPKQKFIPMNQSINSTLEQSVSSKDGDSTCETPQKFYFSIYPVKRPKYCLFRKRNTKYKYINLKSFLAPTRTYIIFKSNIAQITSDLARLSLDSNEGTPERQRLRRERDISNCSFLSNVSCPSETTNDTIAQSKTNSPKKRRWYKKARRHEKKILKKQATSDFKFPEYISEQEVKEGLEKGELIKGYVRVNAKNSRNSYVSNEDSSLQDYYITSVADRNRALDGDEVVLALKPESEWSEGKMTAVVVYILDKVHPRIGVGTLKVADDKTKDFAVFLPRDKKLPPMLIPMTSWPNGFKSNPKLYEQTLFIAKLVEWPEPSNAKGVIIEALGMSGDLRVETQSILKEYCLDTTPFPPEVLQFLPKSKDIPQSELNYREDIRKECVFTIDPLTARDLDDAVSVKKLDNGHYEVGVHISDASYYLPEGSELDKIVSAKATTIYLVDNVYHMLPVELCLHCSLLPGEDKLAFSVFWEMDEEGEVFNTRFARTVLNSCTQLAYEHAQCMIECPDKKFGDDELPKIYNGFTAKDLSDTVNVLQKIAVKLREARINNGSLRIDQVKLLFSLNPQNGEPLDFKIYENKECHRLIEEFMLLANISVAKKILQSFPDIAFLRCHEPPKNTMLLDAQRILETCGIHIDVSSSGGINSSLRKYITNDFKGYCRGIVLNHIFAKPMTRARYFCAGTMDSVQDYSHFALSVPIYTHFTSPIRRYADIMVHRLLAACLGYAEKPQWKMDDVCSVAANCNKQKYNAKRAGEASSDLYLAHFIQHHQPYIQECVVIDVKDKSFDAIVLSTGSVVRIYQKTCEDSPLWKVEAIPVSSDPEQSKLESEKKVLKLKLTFPKTKKCSSVQIMVIEMFTNVKVKLKRHANSYKLEAHLLRPILSTTFERVG